jgi:hypothetical protein
MWPLCCTLSSSRAVIEHLGCVVHMQGTLWRIMRATQAAQAAAAVSAMQAAAAEVAEAGVRAAAADGGLLSQASTLPPAVAASAEAAVTRGHAELLLNLPTYGAKPAHSSSSGGAISTASESPSGSGSRQAEHLQHEAADGEAAPFAGKVGKEAEAAGKVAKEAEAAAAAEGARCDASADQQQQPQEQPAAARPRRSNTKPNSPALAQPAPAGEKVEPTPA